MLNPLPWSIAWILAYLIGSIPFGFMIARSRGLDIREHGSGNIGATNVGRVLGRKVGLTCFALDVLKGFLPTLISGLLLSSASFPLPIAETLAWLAVAAMTIVGHMFPVWLNFKGGKGVATGFGALLGIYPVLTFAAAASLLIWLASVKLTRYVGVSSCIAAVGMPLLTFAMGHAVLRDHHRTSALDTSQGPEAWPLSQSLTVVWPYLAVTLGLAMLVIYRHRGNISRTLAGTESKVGQRGPVPSGSAPK
ncbi:MAG: glycerol-3-phosphate 1-O-acyltransferase PlsY [Pyrinomonadaceae bacterium]|nr:glycerol-3-phosphate 1-O-acyltransferase PlsY [Phycisphaerales bacterium]